MNGLGLLLLEGANHSIGEFLGASFATDVPGRVFCLAVDTFEGFLDELPGGPFVEAVKHQNAAHQQGRRISESLARDIGSGAMHGLEHRAAATHLLPGPNSHAASNT